MLVQNLLEIVSVLRATRVQNLDHYLKGFKLVDWHFQFFDTEGHA